MPSTTRSRSTVRRATGRGAARGPAIGVVAYGKLDGLELGWGSDLDLVFYDLPAGATLGPAAVSNGQFVARMAQRIIHALTARTFMGQLYEIDLRLRPSGRSGCSYPAWRPLRAISRTRPGPGSGRRSSAPGPWPAPALCAEFERIRREVLGLAREPAEVIAEVVDA